MRCREITAVVISFLMTLACAVPVHAGTWTAYENNTWSYVNDEGESLTGWITDEEKTYYLDEDGYLKTGWFKLKGSWYYFDEKGVLAKNTWIDNYYVNEEGKLKDIR